MWRHRIRWLSRASSRPAKCSLVRRGGHKTSRLVYYRRDESAGDHRVAAHRQDERAKWEKDATAVRGAAVSMTMTIQLLIGATNVRDNHMEGEAARLLHPAD